MINNFPRKFILCLWIEYDFYSKVQITIKLLQNQILKFLKPLIGMKVCRVQVNHHRLLKKFDYPETECLVDNLQVRKLALF